MMVMVLSFVDGVTVMRDGTHASRKHNLMLTTFSVSRVGDTCECESDSINVDVTNCP